MYPTQWGEYCRDCF